MSFTHSRKLRSRRYKHKTAHHISRSFCRWSRRRCRRR